MPRRKALRGKKLLALVIIVLSILSATYVYMSSLGVVTPKNTGISPTVVLIDSNGRPARLDSSRWVPMSVVDSSGRDVTDGQVEISLDGSFDYQGTISTWDATGQLKAVTEGSKVIKTWPISASGVGAPPAEWTLKISGATKAVTRIAEAKAHWATYGVKAITFKIDASLTVNFADGTTITRKLTEQTITKVGGLTYSSDNSVSNFKVSTTPVTSTGTGPGGSEPSQPPPSQPSGETSTLIVIAEKNNQPVQGAYVFFHNLAEYSWNAGGGKYTDTSGQAAFEVPAETYLQVQVNFPPNGPAVATGVKSASTGKTRTLTMYAEGYHETMNLIQW